MGTSADRAKSPATVGGYQRNDLKTWCFAKAGEIARKGRYWHLGEQVLAGKGSSRNTQKVGSLSTVAVCLVQGLGDQRTFQALHSQTKIKLRCHRGLVNQGVGREKLEPSNGQISLENIS